MDTVILKEVVLTGFIHLILENMTEYSLPSDEAMEGEHIEPLDKMGTSLVLSYTHTKFRTYSGALNTAFSIGLPSTKYGIAWNITGPSVSKLESLFLTVTYTGTSKFSSYVISRAAVSSICMTIEVSPMKQI